MLTFLHTNDFHGTLTRSMAEFVRSLKEEGALYFDCGDGVKSGNLGIPLRPEPYWPLLALAGCDASTLGNRETHVLEAALRAKVEGAAQPILCANLRTKHGDLPFGETALFEREGIKIGVVGVMVPMVTERMASRHASAYLWDPPLSTAKRLAGEMRHSVDCLVALTHIGHTQDLRLAEECPEYDLVFGGHSHTVLDEPVRVGDTFVCQAGSHGRYVGRYRWVERGRLAAAELIPLPAAR